MRYFISYKYELDGQTGFSNVFIDHIGAIESADDIKHISEILTEEFCLDSVAILFYSELKV
jgi:hypothetical protein